MYLHEMWANARDGVEKMWVMVDPLAIGGTKGGIVIHLVKAVG